MDHCKIKHIYQSNRRMTLDTPPAAPCTPVSPTSPGVPESPGVLPRERPIIHPAVDPPLCEDCAKHEMSFFDPNCPTCIDLLSAESTTVPEMYAILRQWTPQTQQNLEILIREVILLY
jgi:CAP-Gly domain-containing linker protein 3/4